MTFIPADSLTFHCRKCSGTINESNLSSNVGSDPFMKAFQRRCRKQSRLTAAGLRGRSAADGLYYWHLCVWKRTKVRCLQRKNMVRDCLHCRCRSESLHCGNCVQSREGAATFACRTPRLGLLLRDNLLMELLLRTL